jgi:integrase
MYEWSVLHDQGKKPGYRRTAMAMKYQKGTVYPRGQKVKMWYGRYTLYLRDEQGKEIGRRRNVPICLKAGTPKWKAEQLLHALILNETGVPAKTTSGITNEPVTFRWFTEERYIPMRQGAWSPAYKKINIYEIRHYLVEHFGRIPLEKLGTFEIQVWLNNLATKYSQSVVRHCYSNIRSITQMAKKMDFLTKDPAEDVTMPQTKPVAKPLMTQDQILTLIGGIQDLHDLCLMYVGLFCGPRASEILGLQWKGWTGISLVPHGTAFEGQFYPGRLKNRSSQAPIGVPEQVRPIIEAWHEACPDPSPEALMFSTFGRGERKGQAVPRWGKNFLKWRIRPIARRMGIPEHLITFQVMRRTLATNLQHHGTLKDAQGVLRHASIRTTGDVYVQTIEASVLNALNSRTLEILVGWEPSLVKGEMSASNDALVAGRRKQDLSGVLQQLDQLGPGSEGGCL